MAGYLLAKFSYCNQLPPQVLFIFANFMLKLIFSFRNEEVSVWNRFGAAAGRRFETYRNLQKVIQKLLEILVRLALKRHWKRSKRPQQAPVWMRSDNTGAKKMLELFSLRRISGVLELFRSILT